ncbi:TonB-dependent receptor [Polaribacter reichenbachii]|uniref:TonB-dependent receptor n=1 Tax=Polaribacter reichenbachii TaxID=996801 RepID=A0A1B8TVU8_9FLAO|nr:outer membrane beta-barrel protein [Polaribacter reichenbachii]APZ45253.1 TonB-dependent receptor [Polaribacter reichenbachii]AUC19116.1 TonB-dependent receptor [Polaribacter reichenbachii]OBY63728.1 TonB-dependent receptor [Polaribacter reichenbachii]
MKALKITIFFFFGILTTFSQHKISGKIVDEQNQPLPFANIVLYKTGEDAKPNGTVSYDDGTYIFDKITAGNYKMEISMLGFTTQKIEAFDLNADKILNITLKEETQTLNEVVVKSKRPIIKQTAEKLIVDLEKSEMINTNLQDVMRKVPGVLVTNNGISIAGNSGVRILINGKTTEYMDVETLLRDFPADNIAKIEVVEQPGAEYQASGSGAIINIILKKNVKLGTHGSVNTWIGEDEGFEWGSGFSIASYKNKLNWQANAGYSQPTWRDDLFLVRTVGDETYDQVTREPYDPDNFRIGGSLDYYINDKHSIGIGARINTRNSTRIAASETIISDVNTTNTLFSENSFDRERKNFNINPYYEYKTDTDKLVIDFNYVDFSNDNTNTLSDVAGSTIDFTDRKYIQDGTYSIKTYRADYSKTFSDNLKISAGTRFADVKTDNDLQSFSQNTNGNFDKDDEESSRFVIDETIFALYSKINATSGKWSFSGGLRYEDSNTDGTSTFLQNGILTSEVKKRPIKKVFPSASISRKFNDILGASLSYSYRIQRPSYSSLNSFATYLDPYSAGEGNPNLTPAYTNNYQFNLTYEGQPFFTIGYSKTDDVLFQLIKQDNETAQIRQQDVNVENNANWNFRLFAPVNFTKGLEGYTGVIVTNTDYQSSTYGVDLNKWNLIWFLQASYQLPADINFELSGNYGTGALEGQIEADWFAELDFSFGKKFLDDKLKVNLGFSKMLNRGFNGTIDYGNGTASVESNGSRQNIQLRFVYSFGSKFGKKKASRNRNTDEEDRINDSN